ncbi:hypothetical protein BC936DRAFT_148738 [Jimgerdemannia flammicorona]|nr:hypothetical protein BC936DRAFT_148738 [Jimgerdemannia flammicorona]
MSEHDAAANLPKILDDQAPPSYLASAIKPRVVLWVDDNPENNAKLIAEAKAAGINVQTAKSTAAACELIDNGIKDWGDFRVITDMHRIEGFGVEEPQAGLKLMGELLTRRFAKYPILLFTGTQANVTMWQAKHPNLKSTIDYTVARDFVLFNV